jgi:hypothetical protein
MSLVELTVEDTFWFECNGLVRLILHPNFSVPLDWEQNAWSQRTEPVVVAKPNGQQIEAPLRSTWEHFRISDPSVSIDKRWRLTLWLTDRTKEEIPVGSRILVSPEDRNAILPHNES